jgi:hypothetical protein
MWQKQPRFKGLYKPIGEVQICRILTNKANIGHILHTKRKEAIYGFFPRAGENREENRSPYRAYFTLMPITPVLFLSNPLLCFINVVFPIDKYP